MRCLIQFFSAILVICAFSCGAKETKELLHYKVYSPYPSTIIHVLIVDPNTVNIMAIRAQESGHGLDSVGNIARHCGAIAAVNGGYFRLNKQTITAVPAGILKINNMWHGIAYQPRGAIGWRPETNSYLIDILQTDSQMIIQDQAMPINVMNKMVHGDKAALLSDSYHEPIDLVNNIGITILNQRIQAIHKSGQISIPADGYIYSVNGALRTKIKDFKTGDPAIVNITVKPRLDPATKQQWNKMPFIIGGGPVLIHKGNKIKNFSVEQLHHEFINGQHARTAVGILPDKRWVFVVADRSPFEGVVGISIPELCDFMASLGCVAALNLDGGGSSTMYIDDVKYGSITDQPVADAVVIKLKQ